MLAPDGQFRQWLKDQNNGCKTQAACADEFCDGLLLRLFETDIGTKIHLWPLNANSANRVRGRYQVNLDIGKTGGYTQDVTDDPLKIIGERLAGKSKDLVCSTDTGQEGD